MMVDIKIEKHPLAEEPSEEPRLPSFIITSQTGESCYIPGDFLRDYHLKEIMRDAVDDCEKQLISFMRTYLSAMYKVFIYAAIHKTWKVVEKEKSELREVSETKEQTENSSEVNPVKKGGAREQD